MFAVALYAEGVGRNNYGRTTEKELHRVALYAEGVGRNLSGMASVSGGALVALYAEGVGRNFVVSTSGRAALSRPLRGGRG